MEVAIACDQDKIMKANQEMQVSISFGKFENDSLSWERFSSFSPPNKYLEEVEKCATPGSVAQKKAYFESHYKKIAERNAEIILEQEKQLESNASFRPSLEHSGNTYREADGSVVIESSVACCDHNGEISSEKDKLVDCSATEVTETCNHEPLEETMEVEVGEDLITLKMEKLEEIVSVEEVEDKEKPEEVVCREEDVSSKDTPVTKTKKEKDQHLIKKTDKNVQTNQTRSSPKTKKPVENKIVTSRKTQPSKEKSMMKAATTTTNKAASPVSKASNFSTPRVSKPSSTTSSISTSRSSVKKDNVSTLPRRKQTASKTLHTSLNLNQPSSDPTALATTTRKSLIMERMGDKEIVRRAFKSFQKSFDQMKPSQDEQDTAPKQVPAKATSVPKLATTGLKVNGRLAKSGGMEKKGSNSHRSSSFVPKSNRTAEKQELSRSGARAVGLQAKPKAEIPNAKTRRKSLDPKAKSMQGPIPKESSDKVL